MLGLPPDGAELRLGAYVAIGLVSCFRWRRKNSANHSERAFQPNGWLFFGAFWVVLAVVEYRGGIRDLTNYWRQEAYGQGWYGERRTVQRLVVRAALVTGAIGAVSALALVPPWLRPYRLVLALSVLTVTFIVIASVSLHSVDAVLGERLLGGIRVGEALEITAAFLVCVAVALAPESPGRRSR